VDRQTRLWNALQRKLDKIAALEATLLAKNTSIARFTEEMQDLNERKLQFHTELSAARHRRTEGHAWMVLHIRQFWHDEGANKAMQRGFGADLRRYATLQQEVYQVKNEGAIQKNRAENCEHDALGVKLVCSDDRERMAGINDEIARMSSETIALRTNATQAHMEAEASRVAILELDERLRKIAAAMMRKDALIHQMELEQEVDSHKMHQCKTESETIRSEMRYLKETVTIAKVDISKLDDACMRIHSQLRQTQRTLRSMRRAAAEQEQQNEQLRLDNDELEIQELKHLHIISESDTLCKSVANEMQRVKESVEWEQRELCNRNLMVATLRERARVEKDVVEHHASHWATLAAEIEKRKATLEQDVEKIRELVGKLDTLRRVRTEVLRLSKKLLKVQTQSKLLADEAQRPVNVHRWTLLQAANPEWSHLLYLKNAVLDRVYMQVLKLGKLCDTRDGLRSELAVQTAAARGIRQAPTEAIEACEAQLQERTRKLGGLMKDVDRGVAETRQVMGRVESARMEIVYEREQFYATKWIEGQTMVPVREPPVVQFIGGQAPRAWIPRLKLSGVSAAHGEARSARAYEPPRTPDSLLTRPMLPPLHPVSAGR
jgi:chromosome segregation ATPase